MTAQEEPIVGLKPHAKLTNTLRCLLKIIIGFAVIGISSGIYNFYSYATLPSDIDAAETLLVSDIVTGIVGAAQFILAIITGITFLRWIYRTNKNLRVLSGEPMVFTPGWAVGWYFVPFANLFKPYQVMKEIWRVSHKDGTVGHAIVGWWWGLWILSNLVGRVAFRMSMNAGSASEYADAAMAYIISDGLNLALNIVALTMVTGIGAAYSRNIAETSGAPERSGDNTGHMCDEGHILRLRGRSN